MSPLSDNTVVFLFTDIEGSTRLWEQDPDRMRPALARHDAIIRSAVESHGGAIVKMLGDGAYATFDEPVAAIRATLALQQAFADSEATCGILFRIRCGLHMGAVERRDSDFFGNAVNRAARIVRTAHGGQVLLSEAVAARVLAFLPDAVSLRDLGSVRLRDLASPERLFQLAHPQLRQTFPALRSLESTPNNLPQQVTSFIGHERVLTDIKTLLENSRLVTLIGAGGLGKTRLSLQVAADALDDYTDGAWFVDLAPIVSPKMVPNAVATVLGAREEAQRPIIEILCDLARNRKLLLILDNCEHLVQACAELAGQLMQAGAGIKILATSREPLHIAGEAAYQVPALAIPESSSPRSCSELMEIDAIRLFFDRAVAARADFRITEGNASYVASICRHLDGIPLAIELAAARVRALPVDTIADRLRDRFRLLTDGNRTYLPRQQTLRASIDWSHELLTVPERVLFRRLAVFAGGWTLEAAEDIAAGSELPQHSVLVTLTHLVDKSLVATEAEGVRFRMLETVREYAHERLNESDERDAICGRHLAFYLKFAEDADIALISGTEGAQWLSRLDADHDNLRAALTHATGAQSDADSAQRLCGSLSRFWGLRVHLREGYAWCQRALGIGNPVVSAARARALLSGGALAFRIGTLTEANHLLKEAVVASEATNESVVQVRALNNLGVIAKEQGDTPHALEFLERAAKIVHLAAPKALEALVLSNLGLLLVEEGDILAGKPFLTRALAVCREVNDGPSTVSSLCFVGRAAQYEGDFDMALSITDEALSMARAIGLPERIAELIFTKADILIATAGDLAAARLLLVDSLGRWKKLGLAYGYAQALVVVRNLAIALHEYARAAWLIAVADAVLESIGSRNPKIEEMSKEECLAICRTELGDDAYEVEYRRGRSTTIDEAFSATLAWLGESSRANAS